MRLGTWNCQSGISTHWDELEALDADVLAIQECGPATPEEAEAHGGWTCGFQAGKYGKGLAVLARAPYRIASREEGEPFFVSTVIDGPERFRFVGFWAMTEKDVGYTYTRQATRMIEGLPDDGLATVVAGDFNASKSEPHLKNVESLDSRGLVSAYHSLHHVDHRGVEEEPTSYFQWQSSRPYHMDFVFVPTTWHVDGVTIGTFDDYPGRKLSDHVPVVVAITPG